MSPSVWSVLFFLCWPRHVHIWSSAMYLREEPDPETLHELFSNGDTATVEGDILLPDDRNAVAHIWKTRDIPYAVDRLLQSRTKDIEAALKMISDASCLTFHEHFSERLEKNYLYFTKKRGCASYVGCIGGKQPVYIGDQCRVGNVAHEVLHALGFYHEHTRMDRDEHVTIITANIRPGAEKNFIKKQGDTMDVPYDISSIMHYGSKYFSSNGGKTIEALDSSKPMGQRQRLTEFDMERVRRLYNCGS